MAVSPFSFKKQILPLNKDLRVATALAIGMSQCHGFFYTSRLSWIRLRVSVVVFDLPLVSWKTTKYCSLGIDAPHACVSSLIKISYARRSCPFCVLLTALWRSPASCL